MIKVYVINLEKSADRWQQISSNLDELGIQYERIEAVYGKDLSDFTQGFDTKRFHLESGHQLVPGEAGCSGSHINIWQKMVDEHIDQAVVLEDDAIVTQAMCDVLEDLMDNNSFDYLKLEHSDPHVDTLLKSKNLDYWNTKQKVEGRTVLSVEKRNERYWVECDPVPYLTAGYVISNFGARTFLKSAKDMYYPIDLLPRYTSPYTKQGYIYPLPVIHADEDSSINGRVFKEFPCSPIYKLYHKIFCKSRIREFAVRLKGWKLLGSI